MPYYNPYYTPYVQPTQFNRPTLQGKVVDSTEVVKAIDIPLDGSTSYFPMADGSAIVSKQLQQDGTSRITIYKPAEESKPAKLVTENDLSNIKEEIKELKKQLKEMKGELYESNRHD